jgi:hypothetical protein
MPLPICRSIPPSPSVGSWMDLLRIGSRPSGAFGEIVVSAQELNVFGINRGAAFGVRHNVIVIISPFG